MTKRCDLCGKQVDEHNLVKEERAGIEKEICHDCLHGGYSLLGNILSRLRGGSEERDV